MASDRQIQAARENGMLSRGPVSARGRERSKMNALKHGFCSDLMPKTEVEAALATKGFDAEAWLNGQLDELGSKIELAQEMQRSSRERASKRSEVSWHDDRRLEASKLGEKLMRKDQPDRYLQELRRTPQ